MPVLGPNIALGAHARAKGGGVSAPSYDARAIALFARYNAEPSATRKGLLNNLIVAAQDHGWFDKMDMVAIFGMGLDDPGYTTANDPHASRRNIIQDAYNPLTVNAPTFTTDRGYYNPGTSYLNSQFNPATAVGAKFVRDSASMGYYSRTSRAAANTANMGTVLSQAEAAYAAMKSSQTSGGAGIEALANDKTSSKTGLNVGTVGHFAFSRENANSKKAYFNGALAGEFAVASTGVAGGNIFILCQNFGNAYNNGVQEEYSYAFVGGALTPDDVLNFTNDMDVYLSAVGALI